MAEPPLDRRAFFRQGLRSLARTLVETVDAARGRPPGPGDALARRLRPPGALAEAAFLEACSRCDDCIAACPAQCLVRVPEGYSDAGTPVLLPPLRACVLCTGLDCTHACTTGALRPLHEAAEVRIGLAVVHRRDCSAWEGSDCQVCHDVCPTLPKAILLDGGRPRVEAADCTGCGLCEMRCPEQPRAILVLPLPDGRPEAPRGGEG